MAPLYHEGMRHLQDARDTRRARGPAAERDGAAGVHDEDRAFIERCPMFFLATADAEGRPDCSYKGGLPGFVRVVDERTLAFPDYDGNGMYRSLGNVEVNPHVALLFIDFTQPKRLRVNGIATLGRTTRCVADFPGAVFVVRVAATHIFPNCPRYVHRMALVEPRSTYAPRENYEPPVPAWKTFDAFRDALPARDREAAEEAARQQRERAVRYMSA